VTKGWRKAEAVKTNCLISKEFLIASQFNGEGQVKHETAGFHHKAETSAVKQEIAGSQLHESGRVKQKAEPRYPKELIVSPFRKEAKRWLKALEIAKIIFEDQGYHTAYLEEMEKFIRRKIMYSPKIKEEFIPVLFRISASKRIPMTKLVNQIIREYLEGTPHGPTEVIDERESENGSPEHR